VSVCRESIVRGYPFWRRLDGHAQNVFSIGALDQLKLVQNALLLRRKLLHHSRVHPDVDDEPCQPEDAGGGEVNVEILKETFSCLTIADKLSKQYRRQVKLGVVYHQNVRDV
jgi:hypothetical protein